MKEKMKVVFVNAASLMLLALAAALLAQIPFLEGSEVMLGVVLGSFLFSKTKELVQKLPALK